MTFYVTFTSDAGMPGSLLGPFSYH